MGSVFSHAYATAGLLLYVLAWPVLAFLGWRRGPAVFGQFVFRDIMDLLPVGSLRLTDRGRSVKRASARQRRPVATASSGVADNRLQLPLAEDRYPAVARTIGNHRPKEAP